MSAGAVVTAVPVLMVTALGPAWLEARLVIRTTVPRRDRALELQSAREPVEGVLRCRAVP